MYTPSGMGMYPPLGYGATVPGMQRLGAKQSRDGFQEYGSFAESSGILDALASVVFDPGEELVWTGSQGVREPICDFSRCFCEVWS